MESLHGLTKGTELEPLMAAMAQGEANGTMMYYALARLAKEQGLDDVAKVFIESANQEAVHAGFYATLNGRCPKDFWQFVAGVAKAEYNGKTSVKALADKVRAAGFDKAADEMEIFAEQEWHHGVVIDELIKKYAPKISDGKKWICSVCGYEHVGDTAPEACPVCGQPASVFKEKVQPAQKTFVCTICGYEHVGDAAPEVCPVCGQPAFVFKEKA
ncbi:MAG: rubrerythrin [Selenomonadaceae bacterium]|nr:rubrerythrin [Selenomonadaceae bacterium]